MLMSLERIMDKHGNVIAQEGVTRCPCGAKYWENDKCVSCGAAVPVLCANCGEAIVQEKDDPWFHDGSGEERCWEDRDEFASPR